MKALICGITGQDGAYLARLLLNKGYEVIGLSRKFDHINAANLKALDIDREIEIHDISLLDYPAIEACLKKEKPEEIYNLSGQSSVALSYLSPGETLQSLTNGNLNILDAIRQLNLDTRFFHACSGECFGETVPEAATENSSFAPVSPYAVAKASSHWMTKSYREAYDMYACSGILFIHESPLRSKEFVAQKVCLSAANIFQGKENSLTIGNVEVRRDWGWAPEFVSGIWAMLQQEKPQDFILCTGQSFTLSEMIDEAFSYLDLDYREYLQVSPTHFRPSDISTSLGNPERANRILNWAAQKSMPDVVHSLIDYHLGRFA